MNWITLGIVLVVIGISAMIIGWAFDWYVANVAIMVFAFWMALMIFLTVPLSIVVRVPRQIAIYQQRKSYIETHQSNNAIEDAALTIKKIELNDWLYEAQYSKSRWGAWSLYPDSIQTLTPIS